MRRHQSPQSLKVEIFTHPAAPSKPALVEALCNVCILNRTPVTQHSIDQSQSIDSWTRNWRMRKMALSLGIIRRISGTLGCYRAGPGTVGVLHCKPGISIHCGFMPGTRSARSGRYREYEGTKTYGTFPGFASSRVS